MRSAAKLLGVVAFLTSSTALAAPNPPSTWTAERRTQIQNRLFVLWNELDLAVRNHRSNESAVERQEREFRMFRVFDRIPLRDELHGLEAELNRIGARFGISGVRVKLLRREAPASRIPRSVFVDGAFRLAPDATAETLQLQLAGTGTREALLNFVRSWDETVTRLLVPEEPRGGLRWTLSANAYRFRDVRFPKILPREPRALLPGWARTDPKRFADLEPELWRRVEAIEALIPSAKEAYPVRERFLLNSARMSFFLAKSMPGDEAEPRPPRKRAEGR